MKYDKKTALIIVILFICSQVFGIAINYNWLSKQMPYGIEPIPDMGIDSVLFVFGAVIAMTVLILFLRRLGFQRFFRAWFFFAIWVVLSVSLSPFFGEIGSLFTAFFLVLIRFREKDVFFHNMTEVLVYGGIASILAPAFGVFTSFLLLAAISIYDVVSVFYTKHMVSLAKFQSSTGVFSGFMVPTKKGVAMLGGGDIAFPMIALIAILNSYGLYACIMALLGATAGLLFLIFFGKEKKFYPAMPFLFLGLLLGFALIA
jgi:presenilin-like A22 family membrane protease